MLATFHGRGINNLFVTLLALAVCHSFLQPVAAYSGATGASGHVVLLPDDRLVQGTIEDVKSGQIQVNIGELMPVFLSMEAASEKGLLPLQPGDKLTIIVSSENEFIDFHLADQPGWDRVLKGHLIQPMVGDQRWAVIRTMQGTKEP